MIGDILSLCGVTGAWLFVLVGYVRGGIRSWYVLALGTVLSAATLLLTVWDISRDLDAVWDQAQVLSVVAVFVWFTVVEWRNITR
jgi:hypothetical protein